MKVLNMLKAVIIYAITDRRGEYKFTVKGHEVTANFSDNPNKELVPRLKEILLGDAKPPAYKKAKEQQPKEERFITLDAERVRNFIPEGSSNEEAEAIAIKALEHYQQHLKKQRSRDAR